MQESIRSNNQLVLDHDEHECSLDLLACVEEILPRGQIQWEAVLARFNRGATVRRDLSSIRNKFKGLLNAKKPTGEGELPASVQRARAIRDAIEREASAEVLVEDNDDEEDATSASELEHFPEG